jgi:hypothetical protein
VADKVSKETKTTVGCVFGIIGLALALQGVLGFAFSVWVDFQFSQNFSSHLDRAAHAPSIKVAHQELKQVEDYLVTNNLTTGNSSTFYDVNQNDLAYFYGNVKDSTAQLAELEKSGDSTSVNSSNELMRIEGTFKVKGEKGESLRTPESLSHAPNQRIWFWLGLLSFALFIVGCFFIFVMFGSVIS